MKRFWFVAPLAAAVAVAALAMLSCSSPASNGVHQPGFERFADSSVTPQADLRAELGVGFVFGEELLVVARSQGKSAEWRGLSHRLTAQDFEWPKGGELRAKLDEKTIVPLPLKHTDVKARISLSVASVGVKQQYHNPYESKIEAVYLFPLPDDAAISDFVMTIGERRIRGIIREREEAQKIYDAAKCEGHVASLLTQERPNIFTQAVANIEPGRAIDIDITYFHTVRQSDSACEFHFPMVVGPRFDPAGTKGPTADAKYLRPDQISGHDIDLEVELDAGLEIEGLACESHAVSMERRGARAKVKLSKDDRIPNKDFVLRWMVAKRDIQVATVVQPDADGGRGTVLITIQPPKALEDVPVAPREMVFVLDVSGSMNGAPIEAAKRALVAALRRMSRHDTFNIISFSMSASAFGREPILATAENVKRALRYVEDLRTESGTEMITGIKAALEFPHDAERYRIVTFMTDGLIGNEADIFAAIRERLGESRIFSFGIGSSVNRYMIEGMARVGRGTSAFVPLTPDGERAVEQLYQRIERPAMTDLKISWSGVEVADVYPSRPSDLFVGRPLVLSARYKGEGKGSARIEGRVGGKVHVMTAEIDLTGAGGTHPALTKVWARTRIADLHDRMASSREVGDLAAEIRKTALTYGLMSEYTAFIAVDSATVTAGNEGTTVVQPVPVPQGVKYETTVPERK